MNYLADEQETIRIHSDDALIEIDAHPFSGLVPVSIDDRALSPLRDKASAVHDAINDDLEDGSEHDDE